jgi:hypothetical protein
MSARDTGPGQPGIDWCVVLAGVIQRRVDQRPAPALRWQQMRDLGRLWAIDGPIYMVGDRAVDRCRNG